MSQRKLVDGTFHSPAGRGWDRPNPYPRPKTGHLSDCAKSLTETTTAKVGRNDPCPCGSGQKHKLCCG